MSSRRQLCSACNFNSTYTDVCHGCAMNMVIDSVIAVTDKVDRTIVSRVVEQQITSSATLHSIRNALKHGNEALLFGAPKSVGELINALRSYGIELPEPTCVRCKRTGIQLVVSDEGGVCENCRRRQLATACSSCKKVKVVYGRGPTGSALCSACTPKPKRLCSKCGKIRQIALRSKDGSGDICDSCFRGHIAICRVCHRERPCNFVASGNPICASCSPRRKERCSHCDKLLHPTVQWKEGPVCEPCYRAALSRRGICVTCLTERRLVHPPGPSANQCVDCSGAPDLLRCRLCNAEERPYRHGLCIRCVLREQANSLIIDINGPLAPIYQAIISNPQPFSAYNWITKSASATIIAELAKGNIALTHEALDIHPNKRVANLVRQMLVAHNILPVRNDSLVELEAWVATRLDEVPTPENRRMLRSYATWRVLRRIRERAAISNRVNTPIAYSKNCLIGAIAFCAYLDSTQIGITECRQSNIDKLFDETPLLAQHTRDFLDWAIKQKIVDRLVIPKTRSRAGTAMDDETRWAIIHRLLADNSLEVGDRVAGCLVLLYGQTISRIATLTLDQLTISNENVYLALGATRIEVQQPLANLIIKLVNNKRQFNGVATPTHTIWLFPGLNASRPVNAANLGARLRRIGIRTMPGRRASLNYLAARLPAAALAELLGMHVTTAVHWSTDAGASWSGYAAQLVKEPIAN